MKPVKIVFVLSTARTGTKTLAEALSGKEICSPHQPPFSRLLTVASNCHLHGWLPKSVLYRLVVWLRERQILHSRCHYYVQLFSLDYLPASIIKRRLQDVYIVHIVRDPRTFVPSYLNWMHSRAKSYVANKFVPGWHPSGYFTGALSWQEWRRMDEFQRVCWHWDYKNRLLENLFASGNRYHRVRFEELFLKDDDETLKAIFAFAGLQYCDRYGQLIQKARNQSRGTYFPAWPDWPQGRVDQLMAICGHQMERYGYI